MPYADRCFEVAVELLGVKPKTRIPVRIEQRTNIVGWSDRGRRIYMSSRCFTDEKAWREGLFTIFAHELTHHFMYSSVGGHFPPWLVEPLASYFNMEIIRRAALVLGNSDLIADAMERAEKRERQVFEWGNSHESEETIKYIWQESYPESYKHRRMGMYIFIVLRNRYGIEIFRRFVEAFLANPTDLSKLNIHQKNRVMIECFGKAAGENLFPIFRTFGFPFQKDVIAG